MFPSSWMRHDLQYVMTEEAARALCNSPVMNTLLDNIGKKAFTRFHVDRHGLLASSSASIADNTKASFLKNARQMPPLRQPELSMLEPYFLFDLENNKQFRPMHVHQVLHPDTSQMLFLDVYFHTAREAQLKVWCIRLAYEDIEDDRGLGLEGPGRYIHDGFLRPLIQKLAKSEPIPFLCDFCLSVTHKGSNKCSVCKCVRYCGPACQRAAWPKHKRQCAPKGPVLLVD